MPTTHRHAPRLVLAALAFLAALAGPAAAQPAGADDPNVTADDWLRIGLERYDRGNFVGAIEAFERGHAIEPRPQLVFAIAQAHRRRGDCTRARAYFDAFLASNPGAESAAAARDQKERCVEAAPPPAPPAPAPRPEPVAAPPPPPPPGPSIWKDPIVLGAGGTGVVLIGTGVALFLGASSAADQAATAPDYDRHRVLRERAESRQTYGAVALGAGAAAGVLTGWRIWRLRDHDVPAERRAVTWSPTVEAPTAPGHAATIGLTAAGTF